MSIFRVQKSKNYTVMSNYHFREKEMSLKAKGLLSFMLSLPDDWDYSLKGLMAVLKENLRAIKSALQELESFGYLQIVKFYPDENYNSIRYEYNIFEKPKKELISQDKRIIKPFKSSQAIQNVYVDNVSLQDVCIQKHTQISTKKQSTKKQNTKEINTISTEKKIHERKVRDRELKEVFTKEIWERYPIQHRVGEKLCFSKFKSAIKNGSSKEEIIDGFNTYLKVIEINKRKGAEQFIKRLDNWFASESWKNPNRYMNSDMDKSIEKQMNFNYSKQHAKSVWG